MDQKKLLEFLGFWVATAVALLIGSAIFSKDIVLGTMSVSKPMASVFSALIITGLGYTVPKIADQLKLKLKDEKVMAATFFVANVLFIWIVKRFADVTGLGVSNNLFVLILGLGVTISQFGVVKVLASTLKKKS